MKKEDNLDFSPYTAVMLTETFLTHKPNEQLIENFKSYYAEARKTDGRPSGGLAILASPLLLGTRCMFEEEHILGIETQRTTLIVAYYNPKTPVAEIVVDLLNAANKVVTKSVIVYGDFNCRLDSQDGRARDLIEALLLFNLHLINNAQEMTYIAQNGQSAIDLVFVSEDLVTDSRLRVIPTVARKHQQIEIIVTLTEPGMKIEGERPKKPIRKICSNALGSQLSTTGQRADASAGDSYRQLLEMVERSACPRIYRKARPNKRWFDNECRELKQLALIKIGTEEYASRRKVYKNTVKRKRLEYELEEFDKRVQTSRTKPWLMLPQRKRANMPKVDLSEFEKYYGQLYTATERTEQLQETETQGEEDSEWYNEYITNEEVETSIRKMKNHKAAGPDGFAVEILKENQILTPLVTRMNNAAFNSGTIPPEWRKALVKPMYKGKGSPEDAGNYRCISLASHVHKVYTSILSRRLMQHCLPSISQNQHGFLPNRTCEEAVQSLMDFIRGNERPTYAVFIDFKAAFDHVSRGKLIQAASGKFGIKGKMLNAIKSVLEPNSLIIDNGADLSEPVPQHRGLPQGDSVSPLLFVLFINSLLERLERRKVFVKMFADDLVTASENIDELQQALSALSIWCQENSMTVNTSKTKALKFRRAGSTGNRKLYVNRTEIEFVQSFKYLGITMQPALGFHEHVNQLLTRTASAIVCLAELQKMPLTLAMKIFEIKIMPTLRYGMRCISPRLSKTVMEKLDRNKTIFLKATLGVSKHTSNTFVLALAREKTLCEDLKDQGHEFDEEAWGEYAKDRTARINEYHAQNYISGPAFLSDGWRLANRKNRALICRTTYHGYHHCICSREDFFENQNDLCTCKYCGEKRIDRHHILKCIYFKGKTISEIVSEITTNCRKTYE